MTRTELDEAFASIEISEANGATPRYDDDGQLIVELATCGVCGKTWNDALISSRTPAPSGRCPYEFLHPALVAARYPERKRWTLAEIKAANERAGGYFFSRQTMRFFGDTMRSFSVRHEGGKVYLIRVRPMRDRDGRNMGGVGTRYLFTPENGDIGSVVESND